MKKLITTMLSLIIGSLVFTSSAQEAIKSDSLNAAMQKIAEPSSLPEFVKFKEESKINPATIFTDHREAFNLGDNDEMVLFKTETDELGFTHRRYQQFYNNIEVDGGIFIVHTNNNGFTYAANGLILPQANVITIPAINAVQAIAIALKQINATSYKWQSPEREKEIKTRTGNQHSSYYPKPELVLRAVIKNGAARGTFPSEYHLAYRLDIYALTPDYAQRVYVDAQTGALLDTIPLQSTAE